MAGEEDVGEFYLRYYVGHKGKFGHEFLEFEFRPDGKLRYANNSNYKNDTMIRKEVFLTPAVLRECRRIISDSEIMKEDDNLWPEPDRVGRQELEIVMGNEHISFTTSKIGSLVDVQSSNDPEGLRIFYYLVQTLSLLLGTMVDVFGKTAQPSVPAQASEIIDIIDFLHHAVHYEGQGGPVQATSKPRAEVLVLFSRALESLRPDVQLLLSHLNTDVNSSIYAATHPKLVQNSMS